MNGIRCTCNGTMRVYNKVVYSPRLVVESRRGNEVCYPFTCVLSGRDAFPFTHTLGYMLQTNWLYCTIVNKETGYSTVV